MIISAHGMLPILEILDTCRRRDVISNLLKIVNAVSEALYVKQMALSLTIADYIQ